MPADALFLLIGARPHTEWLPSGVVRDALGYLVTGPDVASERAATRWALERPPMMFETSVPGVFAVGDVRAQSVKRVASAVGEGSVVIQQVHQYLEGRPARSGLRVNRLARRFTIVQTVGLMDHQSLLVVVT